MDGSSVGAVTSYTFSNVTANHTISATFAIDTYTITASAGTNGTITPSGATTVNSGGNQAYSITPSTGYHVASVLVDGSSVGAVTSYTFSNVTANHTINATFAVDTFAGQVTLTWNAPTTNSDGTPITYFSGDYRIHYGSTSGNYSQVTNFSNSNAIVTQQVSNLTDGQLYYFRCHRGKYPGHESAYSNEISKTAQSGTPTTYTITASAGTNGTVTPSGATTVNSGASQAYSITPSTGYHVASVLVDGSSVGAVTSYTFSNVTANHTISATFAINTYTITASAGTNGTVTPSGATTVNSGASQAYSITPSTGYHVASVLVDGSSVGTVTSYTFSNVTANHTISATFAINTYTITASAGANGTVTPSGATTVNSGASQAYSITPSTGYHVASVLVDGSSVGAVTSYTFSNVTANHTISATFAINTYTITASAGANGTITPSGATTVNSGASQAYSITPSTGYHVASVLVDGSSVGAVTSYTFSNVTANHTISATFAINTYTITASAGPNGTITPAGVTTVNSGASQAYSITPSTGYHVASVLVDGSSVGAVTSYTFSNVTANHTISATFAINTYTITASAGTNGTITPSGALHSQLRGQPGIHNNAKHRVSCGKCPCGRFLGRSRDFLHLQQRNGQSYDLSHLCN